MELARTQSTNQSELIASQLMDVIIRVKVVRPYGVNSMVSPSDIITLWSISTTWIALANMFLIR